MYTSEVRNGRWQRTDRGRATTTTGRITGRTHERKTTKATTGHEGTDGQRTDDDGTDDGTDGRTEDDDGKDITGRTDNIYIYIYIYIYKLYIHIHIHIYLYDYKLSNTRLEPIF